jgi:hypothetical protein
MHSQDEKSSQEEEHSRTWWVEGVTALVVVLGASAVLLRVLSKLMR